MSSILEALEKAEVERVRSSDPVVHPLPAARSEKRLNVPLIAGVLVLLLLINLLVWWFYLRQEQQPEPPPTVPLSDPPAPSADPVARPVVNPEPEPLTPEPAEKSTQPTQEQPVMNLRESLLKSTAPSARPLFEEAKVPAKPAQSITADSPPESPPESTRPDLVEGDSDRPVAVSDVDKPPAPAQPVATTRMPIAPELPVATAAPPLASEMPEVMDQPQVTPAEQIPLVWELSQQVREKVLQLKSTVHVYSKQPDQRFIIINMRRYSEGDSLPPHGFRLERIDQDGVIIDHGEGLVRLPRR